MRVKAHIRRRSSRRAIGHRPSAMRQENDLPSDVRIVGELLAQGYKPHDIAVLLQIPVSAVRARQRRWKQARVTAEGKDCDARRNVTSANIRPIRVIRVRSSKSVDQSLGDGWWVAQPVGETLCGLPPPPPTEASRTQEGRALPERRQQIFDEKKQTGLRDHY